ncbi:MAG: hypothetical protein DRN27_08660 [Thermoplasmata archaeon]|nr:MAG: hypothetical protein DRN27_08660 [Thermoplasmata archaeon]
MILSKFKKGDKVQTSYSENIGVVIEKQYFDYLDMYVYLVTIKNHNYIKRENELLEVTNG